MEDKEEKTFAVQILQAGQTCLQIRDSFRQSYFHADLSRTGRRLPQDKKAGAMRISGALNSFRGNGLFSGAAGGSVDGHTLISAAQVNPPEIVL